MNTDSGYLQWACNKHNPVHLFPHYLWSDCTYECLFTEHHWRHGKFYFYPSLPTALSSNFYQYHYKSTLNTWFESWIISYPEVYSSSGSVQVNAMTVLW